jgi:hypothetical protein
MKVTSFVELIILLFKSGIKLSKELYYTFVFSQLSTNTLQQTEVFRAQEGAING